jgi:hypothetical protein
MTMANEDEDLKKRYKAAIELTRARHAVWTAALSNVTAADAAAFNGKGSGSTMEQLDAEDRARRSYEAALDDEEELRRLLQSPT